MLDEAVTISFVGTAEIKAQLERWAQQDDRSISYVLRKILEKEAQSREASRQTAQAVIKQQVR